MDQYDSLKKCEFPEIHDSGMKIKEKREHEEESETVHVEPFVPNIFHKKYVKLMDTVYGVLAVVFVLVLISLATLAILNASKSREVTDEQPDEQKENVKFEKKFDVPKEFILRNKNKLQIFNSETKELNLLQKVNGTIDTFCNYGETIFWTESNSSKVMSMSVKDSNETEKNIDTLFKESRVKATAMAIDDVTGNLYLVDESMGGLIVINIFTKNYSLILTELNKPCEIVLDPSEGLLFILERDQSITRFEINGMASRKFSTSPINTITIDTSMKKLYWIEISTKIVRSDYNGLNRVEIFQESTPITSISATQDHIFWLSNSHRPAITFCEIVHGACKNYETHLLEYDFRESDIIKLYQKSNEDVKDNVCVRNNGGCQHLCLLTPNGQSCACHMGWKLNNDLRSCSIAGDFMLYTLDAKVRGRILDVSKSVSVDVIWPTPYIIASNGNKFSVMFEYNFVHDEFYFIDDDHMYKMNLNKYQGQSTIFTNDEARYESFISSIAYDPFTERIYYMQNYFSKWSLLSFNILEGIRFKKVILTRDYDHELPYDTVVYPTKDYIFYTTGPSIYELYIQHAFTNGTEISRIKNNVNNSGRRKYIALDYDENRIYWISNVMSTYVVICHAKFNGYDEEVIKIKLWHFEKIETIYVHQNWVYLSTHGTVFRADKKTGENVVKIVPGPPSYDINTISDVIGPETRIDGVQIVRANSSEGWVRLRLEP